MNTKQRIKQLEKARGAGTGADVFHFFAKDGNEVSGKDKNGNSVTYTLAEFEQVKQDIESRNENIVLIVYVDEEADGGEHDNE